MASRTAAIARHCLPSEPQGHAASSGSLVAQQPTAGSSAAAWPPEVPARPFAGFASPTGRSYERGTPASLMGNMEPVVEEAAGPLELLHGAVPDGLEGHFIRTGPNPAMGHFGNWRYHEFEGDGMLHATELAKGNALYKNRYVQTKRKALQEEKGRALKQVEKMDSNGGYLGTANTNLVYHAKQLLALYEVDRPYALSVPQLETIGQWSCNGSLTHNMTAHPKVCPVTGELMFFGYELASPRVHYAVADKEGKLLRSFSIPTQGGKPVMMHDMAITAKHSLLLEFPLYFEMARAMKGEMPYVHDTTSPSRFGILPRHAAGPADVRWFEGKSAMSFHVANAWEQGDVITLVGCPQETFSFAYGDSSPSVLYEWTFDLSSGKTMERKLDGTHIEFPVVHPRVVGRRGRFVWCAVFAGTGHPFHSICGCIKYDLQSGTQLRHNFVGHRWGGESVFASTGDDEDAGYLLTYTFNPEDNTTELYIVDARTMDPNPVAILRTPQRIPFGFHGVWVPLAEL